MRKKIVYTRPDGGITVVHPATDDLRSAILRAVPKDAANVKIVDEADIPQDRYFRDAWEQDADTVGVNRPKAEEIKMNLIRKIRNKKLEELDLEVIKNIRDETKLDEIEVKKQALRDLPDNVDLTAPTTLEELKNLEPDILK